MIEALVREREAHGAFQGLTDLCERLPAGELNKRALESLILAGAFDSLGRKRTQYMAIYKTVLDSLGKAKKTNLSGQMNLFDLSGGDTAVTRDVLPPMEEYPAANLLAMEKAVLGVYLSGHPLEDKREVWRRRISRTIRELTVREDDGNVRDGEKLVVGGIIHQKSVKYTKADNKPMAVLTLEDFTGSIETVVYPAAYARVAELLQEETAVLVEGRLDLSDEEAPKVMAAEVTPLDREEEQPPKSLGVSLPADGRLGPDDVTRVLKKHPGKCPVYIRDLASGQTFKTDRTYWTNASAAALRALEGLVGPENVKVKK